MKDKKRYLIIGLVLAILILGTVSFVYLSKSENEEKNQVNITTEENLNLDDKQIELFNILVGLESKEMKIVSNPLRIEGTFIIPKDTALNGIEYYLKSSNNKDIKDVEIELDSNTLKVNAKYNLFGKFKTPVEMSVVPSLTKESDIKLDLKDIKVLNLKINQKIIDGIIGNWFSNLNGISVDGGDVVIDKRNFKSISIKDLSIEDSKLLIGLSLKLN